MTLKIFVLCFNPRTHTACDAKLEPDTTRIKVSIHARTRRATFHFSYSSSIVNVSIHARTRRATWRLQTIYRTNMFQSTHAHGVRPQGWLSFRLISGFNPRTHTACDQLTTQTRKQRSCFNPRTHTACDQIDS